MQGKKKPDVVVVMGSDSDWPIVEAAAQTLASFDVTHEVRVISAHRTPEIAAEFARGASRRGVKVILAAAGGAAHLAGVLAAHTVLPVIGIPIQGGALNGMDALLATVQMPSGVPVGTVAVGRAGPVNAALLAVQILALSRPALGRKLLAHKRAMKRKVARGNAKVQNQTGGAA